mmetsp:Transcript_3462/g.9981  ORF Transcript_3462/g.9981 Transcript_3462/m.9981 type:complete len:227 (-) Transcript_3462:304-984(-)
MAVLLTLKSMHTMSRPEQYGLRGRSMPQRVSSSRVILSSCHGAPPGVDCLGSARRCSLSGPAAARSRRGCSTLSVRAESGMQIPSDSFGGVSPEKKAADALRTLFTFVAARVVLSQLERSGRGSHETYNADAYEILADHLASRPMKDGDKWLAELIAKNKLLGCRISEVREAYAEDDFQWDQLRNLAVTETKEQNVSMLRETMETTTSMDTLAEHPYWPAPNWLGE